ncbi:hypothetical protein EGW08_001372 [Elysia chlorotica]|uniref:Uncharacterized protein n=1 Tax=Elysia chlorotica TaxID=188477 RepID=A0A3S1A524_ELYCH|nr:hypothetical protein EGW08_001372 [Elysia chlorotica]
MFEVSDPLFEQRNLSALSNIDHVISTLAKANSQRSSGVQLYERKFRRNNSFEFEESLSLATDSDSVVMNPAPNFLSCSDLDLLKRMKAPQSGDGDILRMQPNVKDLQALSEMEEATTSPRFSLYSRLLMPDKASGSDAWPIPPPFNKTGDKQCNKTVGHVSGYALRRSATTHTQNLRSSLGTGKLNQKPSPRIHRLVGGMSRSKLRNQSHQGATRIQLVDNTEPAEGSCGENTEQRTNTDNIGGCGVLTYNTATGRHEWKLLDSSSTPSSILRCLKGHCKKNAPRHIKENLVPSGPRLPPYQKMERRWIEKKNSNPHSLPQIIDLNLKVEKCPQRPHKLDVCGEHINLPEACGPHVDQKTVQFPQVPRVQVVIPALEFSSNQDCVGQDCEDSQTDRPGEEMSPLSDNDGPGSQHHSSPLEISVVMPPSVSGKVSEEGDTEQDQAKVSEKTITLDSEQNNGCTNDITNNNCDEVRVRNHREHTTVWNWADNKDDEAGPFKCESSKLSFKDTTVQNIEIPGQSEEKELRSGQQKTVSHADAGEIIWSAQYRKPRHQDQVKCPKPVGSAEFSVCEWRRLRQGDAGHPPADLGYEMLRRQMLSTFKNRPYSVARCDDVTKDNKYNIKPFTPKNRGKKSPSSFKKKKKEASLPRLGKIGSPVIPPPYPRDHAWLSRSDSQSSDESQAGVIGRPMKSFSGTRLLRHYNPAVLRMRVELPPPDPNKLCFMSNIPGCSHEEILQCLETTYPEIKVASLQYDPIHLQDYRDPLNSGQSFKCMWLFTLTPESDASQLLLRGIRLRAQRMNIRRADDVYAEEQRSFSLCCEMLRRGLLVDGIDQQAELFDKLGRTQSQTVHSAYTKAERKPAGRTPAAGRNRIRN